MRRRKIVVLIAVVAVAVLAHWPQVSAFVVRHHFDLAARWLHAEFLTGTAITILLARP